MKKAMKTTVKSAKSEKIAKVLQSKNDELSNKQRILQAAEMEFLEKGYDRARTTTIVEKAGVTIAMLHYYFKNKEGLFKEVFLDKITLFLESIDTEANSSLPFEKMIKKFVELHFDFLQKNPMLISFILREVFSNQDNRRTLMKIVTPKIVGKLEQIEKLLKVEIAKKRIKPIKAGDLILNIAAMNASTFVLYPVLKDVSPKKSKALETFVNERKASNVKFILNALYA